MGTSIFARLPLAMSTLSIVLLVSRSGSYTRAGLVVSCYVVGVGTAGPVLGRAVDRFGRPAVLNPTALVAGALFVVLSRITLADTAVLYLCALAMGLFTPPVAAST